MTTARALCVLLAMSACATAPAPKPRTPPPRARTAQTQPAQTLAAGQRGLEVIPAQLFIPAEPITVPPELVAPEPIAVPTPGAIPGPAPFIVMPDELREVNREVLPRPPPKTSTPEAKPDEHTPRQDVPREPGAPTPEPAPVIMKPEPQAPGREPEEAVRRGTRDRKLALMPKPPEVKIPDEDWKPEPGQRWDGPCVHKGTQGPGSFRPEKAPPDWIHCLYQCGRYEVRFYDVLGKSGLDCLKHLERAQREASKFHKDHRKAQ